ncbi:MAG: transposase [Candidatus Omnitrophota bacterium]
MPRNSRTLIWDCYYHIIARGNQKQQLFIKIEDYQKYLHVVWKYKKKFQVKIHAYCIMNNHVHLLINPLEHNLLSKFMHAINMTYAQYFNYQYEKCGHVWQNRYKSYIISKDSYMINCINYIEYNPVRNNIVDKPEEYPWSSYRTRSLGEKNKVYDVFESC